MTERIEYAGVCFTGLVRENNEDNFWCNEKYLPCVNAGTEEIFKGICDLREPPAFAVFDGMGGEASGETASYLAAEGFDRAHGQCNVEKEKNPEKFFRNLCQNLNDGICDYARENDIASMGSTAAMLFFWGQDIYSVNVGDSRIYRFADHKLLQVSEDHVYRSALYRNPPLTQYLGIPKEEMMLSPHTERLNFREGEVFLLCSDGLTKMFTDGELEETLNRMDSVEEAVGCLREETLSRGAWDNTTILLCKVTV